MAIESKLLPTSPWKGLYVDGMTVPGGLSVAENVEIMANGWIKRRLPTRTLDDALTVKASQGLKELVEFRNAAGTRYLFADMNISTTMKIMSADVTGTTDYECGTWADAITGLTAGTSILPQYAVMQDRLYRVDGTNSQYVFTTNSAYSAIGVVAPSAAPTVSETTGGSLTLLGEYKLYYTYVRKGTGYEVESDPSPVATVTLTGSNSAINITIVSSGDTSVTHVRLYRTLYGTPSGYAYYDKEIAKATYVATPIQTFTTADGSMSTTAMETDNDVPPTSIGLAVAGNRMFYLTKTAVYWSKIEEPEHVPPTWYSGIDPNDGDLGMAICAMQNYVLAFKRKKTFLYDATSASVIDNTVGIARQVVSTRIGCIAQNSVQSCGEQNCIIWLADEGVMKWSGGEITNISKDRVNSIIASIINTANSEYYVDSAYYGKKYHLLLVERNAGATAITDQRHLVYNFETDSWTEYKYYAADNTTRYYETNLAVTTDSNKKDVFVAAISRTTVATSAYLDQTDYTPASTGTETEILDSTGDGVTVLGQPAYSTTDSSNNVYIVAANATGKVFRVSSSGTKSCQLTNQQITEGLGYIYKYSGDVASVSGMSIEDSDKTSGYYYSLIDIFLGGSSGARHIVQVGFDGSLTDVTSCSTGGDFGATYYYPKQYGDSDYLFFLSYEYDSGYVYKLYRVTSPGAAGQSISSYYTVPTGAYCGIQIYSDDLYLLYSNTASYTNYQLIKFTTITGTAAMSLIDTGISATTYTSCGSFLVSEEDVVYIEAISAGLGTIFSVVISGATGMAEAVNSDLTAYTRSSGGDANIQKTTLGNFIICNYNDAALIFNSEWSHIATASSTSLSDVRGVSRLGASSSDENNLILCGYDTDNVYKIVQIDPETVLDYFWADSAYADTDMDINGVFGKIVSNYEDLTIPNHKRVNRAYLDVMSEYATCGVFAIESDYTSNRSMHSDDETAEPSSSVSRAPFATGGEQTWNTNSSFNSGNVENWETSRLDVGVSGRKFRYSIKFGDVPDADEGTMYIKPPQFLAQILGNY